MEERNPQESRPEVDAWNRALRKLSRKERTSQEIRKDLLGLDYSAEIIAQTIERLIELRFIDDQRYAESYTRLQGSRGKGPAVIQNKLRQKGLTLTKDEITRIVEEAQGRDDFTRALEIIERRYPGFRLDRMTGKKAYEALIRRGFSFEIARRAILSPAPNNSET